MIFYLYFNISGKSACVDVLDKHSKYRLEILKASFFNFHLNTEYFWPILNFNFKKQTGYLWIELICYMQVPFYWWFTDHNFLDLTSVGLIHD